ncbi:ABC transporter, ATP-binding protein [Fusobacterium gonidiaformans 3-1-5R]|uniref:ABC transporter, ATP-binding protein n=1 Tax=Fusobacterium gonidiaformans 3-1-5R TaxID=469605 RepID=E5BH82_9FUSO|nr:ABC-F family ATP-binding cassette domain-containing protein [Fusobacterium gonidiaformans]EFS21855.1 ABC transporter, ATP-binding protein [Fusobacterium gonidiaformans 3-1-5R]
MALVQVSNLYMGFSGSCLFRDINFSIDEKDKIALIGMNGAGKTTLVKILLGLEYSEVDPRTQQRGNISTKNGIKIGYLSQNPKLDLENTVFEEMMTVFSELQKIHQRMQEINISLANNLGNNQELMNELGEIAAYYEQHEGYAVEYRVKQILRGLSLKENLWEQKIKNLSGGQLSRVALGKILLEEPDLLVLDEPTNHLDLNSIAWLEKTLKSYPKAIFLVSHDVYFLDNVANRIYEMEGKTLKAYSGNYTDFVIQKEAYLSGAVKAYEKEQEKIQKMEEFIRRYKAGVKSKQARGREKILNRMDKMENPVITTKKMKLKFDTDLQSVDLVLELKKLCKSFSGKKLFENLDLKIYRGERVGIIGKNGTGKSTLLKIINSLEKASEGTFSIGEKVKIGYYDQNHQGLGMDNNVLEELMYHFTLSEEEARNICGAFLFREDDIYKKISSLSGGEKARVAFMKLMLEKPNFLILDEPTNHLDLYSREILMNALEDYSGTLLVVSHDRNFLDQVVRKIYRIEENGFSVFHGDYSSYLEEEKEVKEKSNEGNLSFEEQKKQRNRVANLERKTKKLEEEIARLEEKKSICEKEYEEAGRKNDLDALLDLQRKLEEWDEKIFQKLEAWEELESEKNSLK